MSESQELKPLEDFILNNPSLDRLNNLLQEFNIFETLKLTTAEIRHSNVIAWLLNPSENHGISSYFLKQFFKFLVSTHRESFEQHKISLFDFELFKYADVEIRREWKNIDILLIITEDEKKVVVAIENKLMSSEHDNQLSRYRDIVEEEFDDDFEKLFVYLTPGNLDPSDASWIKFSYETIVDIINDILSYRKDSLSSSVVSFLSQYNTILRRYVVGQSEVEKIAIDIYKQHKQALDIIFEYKPDIYLELSEFLQDELGKNSEIIIDTADKTVIRFTTKTLDSLVRKCGEDWTESNRILLFVFTNYNGRLKLELTIGPGDNECRESLRQCFLQKSNEVKFTDINRLHKWYIVYDSMFLEKRELQENDYAELIKKTSGKLKKFFEKDLPVIHKHFKENWEEGD